MMTERIVEDQDEIARLLAQDLPLRADGSSPEEREVAVGWSAADELAIVTSFIPSVTRRLLNLARAGEFKVVRLYLGENGNGPAIIGVEGELPIKRIRFQKRRSDKREGPVLEEAGPSHLTKGGGE